ncbi:hypothetical protein [Streptomyces ochraceiscleroticus]|uniref:Uncharacterized protein n=1 Tax=Streptomyces ochraceiscleroticus TaxID=47761 RepID=A0ABW1MTC2_9ACTN|nr:hypothetical protein [Streptomyces ochraceiscleroticus]
MAAGCSTGDQQSAEKAGRDATGKAATGKAAAGRAAADGPAGILGANFNEDPDSVTFAELRELSASWLRGFVPMPEVGADASRQRAVKKLLDAHRQGYGTVLSLKFPYNHRALPRPDSPAMAAELDRVDKVLHAVLDSVDVLAIANEPFIESLQQDRDSGALNTFYEKIAAHVIAYRKKHFPSGCRTRLYMGALNFLDQPDKRTKATDRWLSFTRATPEIEGVDIHPHVAGPGNVQAYLDYVLPRLRKEQKFLVTEFSLVKLWEQHLKDAVPAPYARRYGVSPDTRVWQVIKQAIEHPVPAEQWRDFLSMSPWFENHKHFLRTQVGRFRDTGRLAVATYGVTQAAAMAQDFGPDKQPWLLNSLYANRTVERPDGGLPAPNYGFFDDFRALQRSQDRRPVSSR